MENSVESKWVSPYSVLGGKSMRQDGRWMEGSEADSGLYPEILRHEVEWIHVGIEHCLWRNLPVIRRLKRRVT